MKCPLNRIGTICSCGLNKGTSLKFQEGFKVWWTTQEGKEMQWPKHETRMNKLAVIERHRIMIIPKRNSSINSSHILNVSLCIAYSVCIVCLFSYFQPMFSIFYSFSLFTFTTMSSNILFLVNPLLLLIRIFNFLGISIIFRM